MEEKQRHGCVTAWLILMIVLNSFTSLLYLFASDLIAQNLPVGTSKKLLLWLGMTGILNVAFGVMLLRWKRIGFWGFLITSICVFAINLNLGLGVAQSILGFIGLGVLFAILQIKKDNTSTWENLD